MTKRKRGPKFKLTPEQERQMTELFQTSSLPVDKIAAIFGVTRATVYNILKRARGRQGDAA